MWPWQYSYNPTTTQDILHCAAHNKADYDILKICNINDSFSAEQESGTPVQTSPRSCQYTMMEETHVSILLL